MNQGKKIIDNWRSWLPWLYMAVAFGLTMLWMIKCGRPYVDSDMSAEMLYANLLNEEGRILISPNWWFSSQVRILFETHVFYRLGLLLFPNNWYAARIFGQAIWMILLLASYMYLCGRNGLNLRYHGAWGAACLACPFGLYYLWYGYMGGQYIPHMIVVLLSLGLIIRLIHEGNWRRHLVQGTALAAMSLIVSMQGPKELMILYLPLVLTGIIALIVQLHRSPEVIPGRELRLCLYSLVACICGVIGYAMNTGILSKIYSFAAYERYWGEFHLLSIFECWGEFLTLLGWQYPYAYWVTRFPIASLSGILGVFGIAIAALLLIAIWRLMIHWRQLRLEAFSVITVFLSALLVQGAIFAYTQGDGDTRSYYWLPILPLVFVILQIACETEHFHWRYSRMICAIGLLLCVAGASVSSVRAFMVYPKRAVRERMPVCDWLVENGYTQGYASFWYADVMTEWTNGLMEVWVTQEDSFPDLYEWLQSTDHADPPQGEFYVLSGPRDHYIDSFDDPEVVYQDDNGYAVMIFDSYDTMLEDLQS